MNLMSPVAWRPGATFPLVRSPADLLGRGGLWRGVGGSSSVSTAIGGGHGEGCGSVEPCGAAGWTPGERGRAAGAAPRSDRAAGAGTELRRDGGAHGPRAAPGRAAAGPLQRLRAVEPRRPAAGRRREAAAADAGEARRAAGAAEEPARRAGPTAVESGPRRRLDREDDGGRHGGRTRARARRRAARPGGAPGDRVDAPALAPTPRASGFSARVFASVRPSAGATAGGTKPKRIDAPAGTARARARARCGPPRPLTMTAIPSVHGRSSAGAARCAR